MSIAKLTLELRDLLGEERVSSEQEVLQKHGQDKWYAHALPDLVVEVSSTEEVSAVLKACFQYEIPVTTRGAGVGYVGGAVPVKGGVVLALAGMNRILEINVKDAIARVEPGVITADLAAAAQKLGWYYPPDPASLKECSLGGNVATNAGGPRCLKYGVTRHYVLGLTAVLMDGTILRCGGRVHKNKTGFDLTGLFVGSEGMLGVITEVTLRLIPLPQKRVMFTATFADFATAAAAVQAIFAAGHLPSALEITDGFTLQAARNRLGAERVPDGNAHLMVEIDGRHKAVLAELDELEELVKSWGVFSFQRSTSEQECEANWQMRREFSYSLRDTGLTKLNEDVVVPRGKLVELADFARQLQEETGIAVATFGHAGDGNLHVNLMVENYQDKAVKARADAALDRLFSWVIAEGGTITGEHGVGLAKKAWFAQAVGQEVVKAHQLLKAALDEKNLLNPEKMWSTNKISLGKEN